MAFNKDFSGLFNLNYPLIKSLPGAVISDTDSFDEVGIDQQVSVIVSFVQKEMRRDIDQPEEFGRIVFKENVGFLGFAFPVADAVTGYRQFLMDKIFIGNGQTESLLRNYAGDEIFVFFRQ